GECPWWARCRTARTSTMPVDVLRGGRLRCIRPAASITAPPTAFRSQESPAGFGGFLLPGSFCSEYLAHVPVQGARGRTVHLLRRDGHLLAVQCTVLLCVGEFLVQTGADLDSQSRRDRQVTQVEELVHIRAKK